MQERRRSAQESSIHSGLDKALLTFTVATGEQEGTTILTLIGPLLLYNLFAFQAELRTMNPPVIILDLEQMPYMDSAGLGLIMNAYVSAQQSNRRFLLAGVSERVSALLTLTRVDEVLERFPSVELAEASVRKPDSGGPGAASPPNVRIGGDNR